MVPLPCRRLSVLPLVSLGEQGSGFLVGGGVEEGISHSFFSTTPLLSGDPIPMATGSPSFVSELGLEQGLRSLVEEGQ